MICVYRRYLKWPIERRVRLDVCGKWIDALTSFWLDVAWFCDSREIKFILYTGNVYCVDTTGVCAHHSTWLPSVNLLTESKALLSQDPAGLVGQLVFCQLRAWFQLLPSQCFFKYFYKQSNFKIWQRKHIHLMVDWNQGFYFTFWTIPHMFPSAQRVICVLLTSF